jgi:putative restriction endonuclease
VSKEDIIRCFDSLRVWKREREGERAPHKPLLVLYALGRWQRGVTTVSFREVEKDLKDLLREFGPPRKSDHPEEPFWRLQNDNVWTVHAPDGLIMKAGHSIPRITHLRSHNVKARFSDDVLAALAQNEFLLSEIASRILEDHFSVEFHQKILDRVGLEINPGFRSR